MKKKKLRRPIDNKTTKPDHHGYEDKVDPHVVQLQ